MWVMSRDRKEFSQLLQPTMVKPGGVTFNINGGGTSQPSRPSGPSEPSNTITITLSSTTGEPGDEIDVRVTSDPSGESVNINSGELSDSDFSGLSGTTPFTRTLILPDEEDRYTFSATSPTLTRDLATVTVEEEEVALGRLSIVAVGAPSNGQQTVRITVRDSDGALAVGAVSVTLRGTGIDRTVPTDDGSGAAVIAVPNTVAVSADGYTRGLRLHSRGPDSRKPPMMKRMMKRKRRKH